MDISDRFEAVAGNLHVGHASAEFYPYSELKHTWKRSGKTVTFKISDYLKDAPEEVQDSLAWYLVSKAFMIPSKEERSQKYLAYSRSKALWQRKRGLYLSRARNLTIEARGTWRDLRIVFNYVNSNYFSGQLQDPLLAWVDESPTTRLGYYFEPLNLLAANRVLDAERVPRYVLEFVVYHELLHHVDAVSGKGIVRVHHTKSFREQEREFSSYSDAEKWLNRLVSEFKRSRK